MDSNINALEKSSAAATWLMVIIAALLCLGALMVFSAGASLDQSIELERFWEYSTMRRLVFVPIVLMMLALFSRLNFRHWLVWERYFWSCPLVLLLAFSIILLILVLIPGMGTEINQSRRWFKIAVGSYGFTFQPSELAKWTVILFLAAYGYRMGDKMREFKKGFLPVAVVLGLVVALVGKEDFGTAALIGAVGVAVMLATGVRWWHLLLLVPLTAVAFYLLVYCDAHRWGRVLAFLYGDSSEVELPSAYHAKQSIMAIGVGGLWGTGLGQGTVKLGWLPEDTTDFVFAVIGEELGLVGSLLIIGFFMALIVVSMVIVHRTNDNLARRIALAIALMVGAQAAMNLCVVTALTPTKGIALPFVSAGGTGLVLTAVAVGILVNIARQNQLREHWPGES